MPNTALIAELEQVRELYNQRQKSANNLQTALKGAASAINKANRSFRDYGAQHTSNGPAALPQAQQFVANLRLREEAIDPIGPELRRQVKNLTSVNGALKDAIAALSGEAVDVIKLSKALELFQNAKPADPALLALVPELEQELQQAQRGLGETFGLALRHALAEQGVAIGGRPPQFEIGPFLLDVDFVKRNARLSYGQNLVHNKIRLSVEATLKAYQDAQKLIMGRVEDGSRWMEQLYTAWELVRRKHETSEPRANIVECYLEMVELRQGKYWRIEPSKHSFVEYTRAQFAYDFMYFVDRQKLKHRNMRAFVASATKSHTDNPERSMFLLEGNTPHAGRYFADLKFDRDE
jgi:hypothetical protein